MEVGLNLLGGSDAAASLSTVSKAQVLVVEQATTDLDLGLGLSLCSSSSSSSNNTNKTSWIGGEYGRILTAKDFGSCISSSSSSSGNNNAVINHSCSLKTPVSGTKRPAADPPGSSSPNGGVSQVVGWPPIRTYRINSLVNQTKNSSVDEDKMVIETNKNKDVTNKKSDERNNNNGNVQKKGHLGSSLFVKVNMDGVPIGRKVDLNAHACYETLAQTLENMFFYTSTTTAAATTTDFIGLSDDMERDREAKKVSKLLGGSSDFVLTYEDRDGDWMLVGDVPWGMFLNTVKRLRIMRTSEAKGLAPRIHGSSDRQRNKPI
ncbi:hypothetical protein IFM89_005698 [Coptis chinensis]|uniref:Auxin-responsive protein n=1 Tax=Coptis chinensis TaxID=261450 RepID=A0A835I045_9MAGN|nr:hypothetical protein IFM89_005698 [Coptis chinensis]